MCSWHLSGKVVWISTYFTEFLDISSTEHVDASVMSSAFQNVTYLQKPSMPSTQRLEGIHHPTRELEEMKNTSLSSNTSYILGSGM